MNFLEQLLAEWYEYQGYFVRTNIKFGKRAKGGYEGEMDIAVFDPKDKVIIHIETSTDADSWEKRKIRFNKKFELAEKHYKSIFKHEYSHVKKIAIVGFNNPKKPTDFGNNIALITFPMIFSEITEKLITASPWSEAISEGYSLLRAIQFALWFGNKK